MHVFYIQADGNLHQTWTEPTSPTGWAAQPLLLQDGPVTSNLTAVGNSLATEQHVFYAGQDGGLKQSWYDGRNPWQSQALKGGLAGSPVAIEPQQVFFVAGDGSLQRSWYDGANWNNEVVSTEPNSPSGTSLLNCEYYAYSILGFKISELHVFYRGQDGGLKQSWKLGDWTGPGSWDKPGGWKHQALPGMPTKLIGAYCHLMDDPRIGDYLEQDVYYCSGNGLLDKSWYDGVAWHCRSIPAKRPPRGCLAKINPPHPK
jgi:hypothetical protein